MSLSRSRTLWLLAAFVLVVLALRPEPTFESWIERAFLPARWLARLCAPWDWASRASVHAAEASIRDRAAEASDRARAALRGEQSFALPSMAELRRGRDLVPVQFVGAGESQDARVIAFPSGARVVVGAPVVCGNTYVGRVVAVDRRRAGEATVELVTDSAFRVGARVLSDAEGTDDGASRDGSPRVAAPVRLVIGGLAPSPEHDPRSLYLLVHVQSARDVESGIVVVDEESVADAESELADGFVLGELSHYTARGISTFAVRARVNYQSGLFRAVVLSTPRPGAPVLEWARDPFDADDWIAGELAPIPDPAFWRESRRCSANARRGVVRGAAVAIGADLAGRVERADAWGSTVSLLGDPGFSVNVLAEVEGEAHPVVLGSLVTLGRDRATGDVAMRWDSSVEIAPGANGDHTRAARLYTGSGEREVPPGLSIGTTTLPCEPGLHVLFVRPAPDVARARGVRVWRDPAVASDGEEQS